MKGDPSIRTWPWPIGLAIVSTVGLVAGLVSDALGDVMAWIGLGLPLAVILRHVLARRPARRLTSGPPQARRR